MSKRKKDYEWGHTGGDLRVIGQRRAVVSDEMMATVNELAFSINFNDVDWPRIARKGDISFMLNMHTDVTIELMKEMYGIDMEHVPRTCRGCRNRKTEKMDIRRFNMAVILDDDGVPYNRLVMVDMHVPGHDGTIETWKLPINDIHYDYFGEREKINSYKDYYYLYLMKEEGTAYYKVGICNNAKMRLTVMQTANPRRINLMGIRRCNSRTEAQQEERQVHQYLKTKTERATGEWYMIEDRDIVDSMKERLFTEFIEWQQPASTSSKN